MKKTYYLAVSFSLIISILNFPVFAITKSQEVATPTGCNFTQQAVAMSKFVNDVGNNVIIFNDGVEVEYLKDDTMIIRDYNNAFNTDLTKIQPRGWVSIGIAIFKVVGACSTIAYISGHDICRVALDYLGFGENDGNYRYLVSGNYVPGYIPGCEPNHSLPCNSGYYEYRVEKVS